MDSRSRRLNLAAWLLPVAAVLVAVGLDQWEQALREEAAASFDFLPAVWAGLGANLVVAALLLLLAWLVAFRRGRARAPAALCLVLGLVLALYPWLFMLAGTSIPRAFMWPPLRDLLMEGGLTSRSAFASNLLALTGLAGLILPGRPADGAA
jgi:uncharacterized membrane protein